MSAGPAANAFTFNGGLSTTYIPTLAADGFTVGSDVRVNRNGTTYHYVAWNEIPGKVDVGTYTGNGADNRNIPGVGFQPDFVMVQTNSDGSATTAQTVAHSTAMGPSTDTSHFFTATANQTNQIQLLQPDGFQVGTTSQVNGNGAVFTYAAWGRAAPTAVRMAGMSARRTDDGVVIEWRTGYEVDNLGFHVYRGRDNGRVRLTTSPLAGSGLLVVARHRDGRRPHLPVDRRLSGRPCSRRRVLGGGHRSQRNAHVARSDQTGNDGPSRRRAGPAPFSLAGGADAEPFGAI